MATIILGLLTPMLASVFAAISCKVQRSQVKRYVRKRQIIGEAAAAAVEALEKEVHPTTRR